MGRRRESPPDLGSRWLACLPRVFRAATARRQPRSACEDRSFAVAPWFETSIRPDPAGPSNGPWPPPWHPVFRQASGCLSCAAYGSLGIGRWRLIDLAPPGDPRSCGRTVAHAHSGSGPLAMLSRASRSGRCSNGPSGFGPATRAALRRGMIMAILENLKEHAECATGLRRPGKRKAIELARMRKPYTVRFKDGLVLNYPRWPLVYRRAVAPAGQRSSPQCTRRWRIAARLSDIGPADTTSARRSIARPARPEHRMPLSPMLSRAP
jgi:hypothetical protein